MSNEVLSDELFYASLAPLDSFQDLARPENYTSVPGSWYVLITDVVGSTQAIESGHYKDVNLLGASSIMAVLNAVNPVEIPFIFGGDGASLLVPPSLLQAAQTALLKVRQLARNSFQMNLRVGLVSAQEVQSQSPLMVAKVRATARYSQASFLGGGLSYATDLIKNDPSYQLNGSVDLGQADLSGLECRWQDVPSPYGHTLSLIAIPRPDAAQAEAQIYRQLFTDIQQIYGRDPQYRPISTAALRLSFNPLQLSPEIKARAMSPRRWHRLRYLLQVICENLLGLYLMRFSLKLRDLDWGHYKADLCTATDYQKLEDGLKMVISGTPAQTQQLVICLERYFRRGQLIYGVHVSDRALMTCLIMDRKDFHIHLVDAADGGYAIAAKALKSRLQTLPPRRQSPR